MKMIQMKHKDFKALDSRDTNNQLWMIVSVICGVTILTLFLIAGAMSVRTHNIEVIQIIFGFFAGAFVVSYINYKVIYPITKRTTKINKKKKVQEPEIVKTQE